MICKLIPVKEAAVQLTLTHQEALDLKEILSYNVTIPEKIRALGDKGNFMERVHFVLHSAGV